LLLAPVKHSTQLESDLCARPSASNDAGALSYHPQQPTTPFIRGGHLPSCAPIDEQRGPRKTRRRSTHSSSPMSFRFAFTTNRGLAKHFNVFACPSLTKKRQFVAEFLCGLSKAYVTKCGPLRAVGEYFRIARHFFVQFLRCCPPMAADNMCGKHGQSVKSARADLVESFVLSPVITARQRQKKRKKKRYEWMCCVGVAQAMEAGRGVDMSLAAPGGLLVFLALHSPMVWRNGAESVRVCALLCRSYVRCFLLGAGSRTSRTHKEALPLSGWLSGQERTVETGNAQQNWVHLAPTRH